jgi:hypothetical protein
MEFMVHEEYGEALVDRTNGYDISFEYPTPIFSHNAVYIDEFRKNYVEEGDIVYNDTYGYGKVINIMPTFSMRYVVDFFNIGKTYYCSVIKANYKEYAVKLSRKHVAPFKERERILLDEGGATIEKIHESFQERIYSIRTPDERRISFNEHLMFFLCRRLIETDKFSLDGEIL